MDSCRFTRVRRGRMKIRPLEALLAGGRTYVTGEMTIDRPLGWFVDCTFILNRLKTRTRVSSGESRVGGCVSGRDSVEPVRRQDRSRTDVSGVGSSSLAFDPLLSQEMKAGRRIVIATFFVISLTAANCVSGRHTTRHADFEDSDYYHRHHVANPWALTESPFNGFDFDGKCQPPYTGEHKVDTAAINWPGVSEIKFMTGSEKVLQGNRKLWCKIKCVEGQWVGPLCSTDGENGRYQPLLRACQLHVPSADNVILSYHDHHKPLEAGADMMVPHGTVILARCARLGSMKLLGRSQISCTDGKWSHKLPTCLATNPSMTGFRDEHPPAIIINVPAGSAGENAAGELVVRPDSIVHLDCIFNRRHGAPAWTWTGGSNDPNRTYPMGWAMSARERNSRYRLSLYHVQDKDEGEYTCATPRGYSNSITIIVKSIQCPAVPPIDYPLSAQVQGNYAGQMIFFSCPDGYLLQGKANATCLTSGQWSTAMPFCQVIECSVDMDEADHRLEFDFDGNGYLGTVRYSCPYGYRLIGSDTSVCQENMTWAPDPPTCEAIECPPLLPPLNGRLIDSGSNFVGDSVVFSCNRNFLLVGASTLTCTSDGSWSHPSPYCQLSCTNPGAPSNGWLSPNSTHFQIGERILVACAADRQLQGRPWLVCQQDGTWSSPVGSCV